MISKEETQLEAERDALLTVAAGIARISELEADLARVTEERDRAEHDTGRAYIERDALAAKLARCEKLMRELALAPDDNWWTHGFALRDEYRAYFTEQEPRT